MTETDIECGHTKTTLHARGVNKSRKIITFSHLDSTNFNDNFKDNFMQEKAKSTSVVLILLFASFCIFSSSLPLGAFSSCFLMISFTSLSVIPISLTQPLNWIVGTVHKNSTSYRNSYYQLPSNYQCIKPSDFKLNLIAKIWNQNCSIWGY